MSVTIIGVGSVTNAMRGKKLLEQQGIRAYIQRKPDVENGCGYRLVVYDQGAQAEQVLRRNGVRIHLVRQGGETP